MNSDELEDLKQKSLETFCIKYESRIKNFVKQNPGLKPPIFWDPIKKEVYWANRKMRRK